MHYRQNNKFGIKMKTFFTSKGLHVFIAAIVLLTNEHYYSMPSHNELTHLDWPLYTTEYIFKHISTINAAMKQETFLSIKWCYFKCRSLGCDFEREKENTEFNVLKMEAMIRNSTCYFHKRFLVYLDNLSTCHLYKHK